MSVKNENQLYPSMLAHYEDMNTFGKNKTLSPLPGRQAKVFYHKIKGDYYRYIVL